MVKGWELTLINPSSVVRVALQTAWKEALQDLMSWIESTLVPAMIFGGLGIKGIAETPFYKFISSPDGLSQLGIESSEPPKLLDAYLNSIKVLRNNNLIVLKFGDVAQLKMGTPHPASGTGFLHIESWMEWILDGVAVNSGFVPRSKLPTASQKSIRVSSAPGGLMLPKGAFGSTGLWRFPINFNDYDTRWIQENAKAIELAMTDKMIIFLNNKLK